MFKKISIRWYIWIALFVVAFAVATYIDDYFDIFSGRRRVPYLVRSDIPKDFRIQVSNDDFISIKQGDIEVYESFDDNNSYYKDGMISRRKLTVDEMQEKAVLDSVPAMISKPSNKGEDDLVKIIETNEYNIVQGRDDIADGSLKIGHFYSNSEVKSILYDLISSKIMRDIENPKFGLEETEAGIVLVINISRYNPIRDYVCDFFEKKNLECIE